MTQSKVFDFKVVMIIQILDIDENSARTRLDQFGGLIKERDVELLTITDISENERTLRAVPDLAPIIAQKGGHNAPQMKTLEKECPQCPVIIIAKNKEAIASGLAEHLDRAHPPATPTTEGSPE